MRFSIQTGPKLHPPPRQPQPTQETQKLRTWLCEYHNPQMPPEDPSPVASKSADTPRRSTALKTTNTATATSATDLDKAIVHDIAKSHLCPYPLVINVDEHAQLQKISEKLSSTEEYTTILEMFKKPKPSEKRNYAEDEKVMAGHLVKLLQNMMSQLQPNRSHNFVNAAERTVQFAKDSPFSSRTKPDLIVVPNDRSLSESFYWEDVTTFIELKKKHCEDLSILTQITRYVLSMIYSRPFMAVNYVMTITGNIARIYRYDAQSFCFTEGVYITDPAGFTDFCKFIAFMTHPDRQKERFEPGDTLRIKDDRQTTKTYKSVSNSFGVLFKRVALFGSRTVCFAGEAHEGSEKHHIVIKLTWMADRLQHHELKVLRHLHAHAEFSTSSSRFKVPQPLGTLTQDQISQAIDEACVISARRPYGDPAPLKCVALVTKAPKAALLDKGSNVIDIIHVFKNLAEILLDVAKTGVQYRDFNAGNILWTGKTGSVDCFLTDFGNARIDFKPRGQEADGSPIEVAKDDFRSCNEVFCSIASMTSSSLMARLVETERSLAMAHATKRSLPVEREQRYQQIIQSTREELKLNILNHFDDLQSAFFCFVYILGQSTKRQRTVAKNESQKNDLLKSLFGPSNQWFDFEDQKLQENLGELMSKLAELVHPQKREQVSKELENHKKRPCLTKVEEECFNQWIAACDDTITDLSGVESEDV